MKSHTKIFAELISIPLFVEQIKRFWIIAVVPMVAYLLTIVIPIYNVSENHAPSHQTRLMIDLLSMQHPVLMIGMIFVPFALVMALYPYNSNHRAATAFYSFPITKRQLFWTNFAIGFVMIVAPLLLLSLMLLVPVSFNPGYFDRYDGLASVTNLWIPRAMFSEWPTVGDTVNTLGRVFTFFLRVSTGYMFYFAVFKLAVTIAGNKVVTVLLSGALPFVPVALLVVIEGIGSLYIFGMTGGGASSRISSLFIFTNPVYWAEITMRAGVFSSGSEMFDIDGHNWLFLLVYVLITCALLAIAYICQLRRRHERTGESVVFTPVKNVCVFLLAFAGAIFAAAFAASRFDGAAFRIVGGLIGFTIMFFVAQMIAESAINIFRAKAKALLDYTVILAVLYVTMFIVTTYGLGFYTNRVPNIADIDKVSIEGQWWLPSSGAGYTRDRDAIAQIVDIHNEILDNRRYLRRVFWGSMNSFTWTRSFTVHYVLNDGTHIRRTYSVSPQFSDRTGITAIYQEDAFVNARWVYLHEPDSIGWIMVTRRTQGIGEEPLHIVVTQPDRIASLAEAIATDARREAIGRYSWSETPMFEVHVSMRSTVGGDARVSREVVTPSGPLGWQDAGWPVFGLADHAIGVRYFEDGAIAAWLVEND